MLSGVGFFCVGFVMLLGFVVDLFEIWGWEGFGSFVVFFLVFSGWRTF